MVLGILLFNVGILSANSPLLVWFFLFLLTLSCLFYFRRLLPPAFLAVYIVMSIISSLLFLVSALASLGAPILALLALFIKLGLPPFHFWAFRLIPFLKGSSLFVFLCGLKVGPLWYALIEIPSSLVLCSAAAAVGCLTLYSRSGLGPLLLSSSFFQPLLLSQVSPSLLVSFSTSYFVCLGCCCCYSYFSLSPHLGLWMLLGVPPIGLFFGKVFYLTSAHCFASFLLLLVSALVSVPYISYSFMVVYTGVTSFFSILLINLLSVLPFLA